jgi:hypothetical protein
MEYVLIVLIPALTVGARLAISAGWMVEESDLDRHEQVLLKRGRQLDASTIAEAPEASVVRVVGEVKCFERCNLTAMGKSE